MNNFLTHLETLIVLVTIFFLVKKGQISKQKTGVVCGQHESILYSKVWNFASKTVTMLLCAWWWKYFIIFFYFKNSKWILTSPALVFQVKKGQKQIENRYIICGHTMAIVCQLLFISWDCYSQITMFWFVILIITVVIW